MPLLTPEQLASMRAVTATTFQHLADVWRTDATSGERVLIAVDLPCSIVPAKTPDRFGTDQGPNDTRDCYTGVAALDADLISMEDQLRNLRTDTGAVWLSTSLTVHTVAKWPAVLAFKLIEEAS